MMDLALLWAEIANGMYKKPVDQLAKEFQYQSLPQNSNTSRCHRRFAPR